VLHIYSFVLSRNGSGNFLLAVFQPFLHRQINAQVLNFRVYMEILVKDFSFPFLQPDGTRAGDSFSIYFRKNYVLERVAIVKMAILNGQVFGCIRAFHQTRKAHLVPDFSHGGKILLTAKTAVLQAWNVGDIW